VDQYFQTEITGPRESLHVRFEIRPLAEASSPKRCPQRGWTSAVQLAASEFSRCHSCFGLDDTVRLPVDKIQFTIGISMIQHLSEDLYGTNESVHTFHRHVIHL